MSPSLLTHLSQPLPHSVPHPLTPTPLTKVPIVLQCVMLCVGPAKITRTRRIASTNASTCASNLTHLSSSLAPSLVLTPCPPSSPQVDNLSELFASYERERSIICPLPVLAEMCAQLLQISLRGKIKLKSSPYGKVIVKKTLSVYFRLFH